MTKTCFERFASFTERQIADRLIHRILGAVADGGIVDDEDNCHETFHIRVHDGEDLFPEVGEPALRDVAAIKALLATTSDDRLYIEQSDGHCIGWVWLVWGNGADLISDYSLDCSGNIEAIVKSIYNEIEA